MYLDLGKKEWRTIPPSRGKKKKKKKRSRGWPEEGNAKKGAVEWTHSRKKGATLPYFPKKKKRKERSMGKGSRSTSQELSLTGEDGEDLRK